MGACIGCVCDVVVSILIFCTAKMPSERVEKRAAINLEEIFLGLLTLIQFL
jgi:hypothetical protein